MYAFLKSIYSVYIIFKKLLQLNVKILNVCAPLHVSLRKIYNDCISPLIETRGYPLEGEGPQLSSTCYGLWL